MLLGYRACGTFCDVRLVEKVSVLVEDEARNSGVVSVLEVST